MINTLRIIFMLSVIFFSSGFVFAKPKMIEQIEIVGKDTILIKTIIFKDGEKRVNREVHGKLHGRCENFYSDGKLAQISQFVDGKEEGATRGFLPDGFVAVLKRYHNGIPVDTHKIYFDNKKPEQITVYDSTGQQNGWCKSWYEATGILSDSTLYAHGDKLQEFLFYPSGKPMFSSTLKADGYIISSVAFYPDGKKSGEVKNGNGRVIIPRHADRTDFYDTLTIVNGKVQNAEHEFFKDR